MGRRAKGISAGLTIGLGFGVLASGQISGLLAGLGFAAAEKFVETKTDSISSKLSKFFTPNYLVNIYEFKKAPIIKKD